MSILRNSIVYLNYFLKKSRKSKVLFFHSIHNKDIFTLPFDKSTHISKLLSFIEIIKMNGFQIVDEIKKTEDEVQLTFDDGYLGIYENMDFFIKYNIKIKIFISPSLFAKKHYMNINQIIELSKYCNFIFGSHSMSHSRLDILPDKKLDFEIKESKYIIEKSINKPVDSFCFPLGFFNDRVIEKCEEFGYNRLYSCIPGSNNKFLKSNIIGRSLVDGVSNFYFKSILFGADEILNGWYTKKHYSK